MTPFRWTQMKEQAALWLAEDTRSNEVIAREVGVTRQALDKWLTRPEFRARIQEHVTAFREAIRAKGIAERVNRVAALNDRWQRMQQVIEARAAAMGSEVPGGETGLLVKQLKMIGKGDAAQVVEEYAVDVALLKELREHERQAAQELGQWTEKTDLTSGGEPLAVKILRGVSMDEL